MKNTWIILSKKGLSKYVYLLFLIPLLLIGCTRVNFDEDDPSYEERTYIYKFDITFSGDFSDYEKEIRFYADTALDENGNQIEKFMIKNENITKLSYKFTAKRENSVGSIAEIVVYKPKTKGKTLKISFNMTRTKKDEFKDFGKNDFVVDDTSFPNNETMAVISLR